MIHRARTPDDGARSGRRRALPVVLASVANLLLLSPAGSSAPPIGPIPAVNLTLLTVGVPNPREPSGMAPPSPHALAGFTRVYATDFSGATVPAGWQIFSGHPIGDPGGKWSAGHVQVANGVLELSAWRDPAYNEAWVAGGVSRTGPGQTYGAFFVRSRMTGPGPTQVEMLWPVVGWPPEIDFSETYGPVNQSMATDHFTPANLELHQTIRVNMERWHTWGVIWTPTKITYVLDGRIWGTVTYPPAIPHQPMNLHIQQQTWCGSHFACPVSTQATMVDWVAAYSLAKR